MQIEIVNVSAPTQEAGARGVPYYKMAVSYKDQQGRMQSKNLVSYVFPEVFNFFKSKTRGDLVDVTVTKNAKGYLDWTAVADGEAGATTVNNPVSRPVATRSANFESKEERDNKQRWIIRQSSLAQAVASLKVDKAPVNPEQVLELAARYEAWVTRVEPNQPVLDMENDIPQ